MGTEVKDVVEALRRLAPTSSLDEACTLLSTMVPPDKLREAREFIEREIRGIRWLRDPATLESGDVESWYPGPSEKDRFWPPYCRLLQQKRWPEGAIRKIDKASTKILSQLHHPGLGQFQTRGLVVGYVQSGKTANFTAVISKAADVGYRMFIVLAGLTNKLRRQTQERLDAELRDLNPEHWVTLTNTHEDFGGGATVNANAFLTQYAHQKTLCVVKKNSSRLQRLLQWIQGAQDSVIANCPTLIIDDEADQASINTAKGKDERTRINRLILDILNSLPKAAYVGYTATPYANIFVDAGLQEDLYPRHFITSLERAENYFGPQKIFGRGSVHFNRDDEDIDGLDMIRRVPEEEIDSLRPTSSADRTLFVFDLDHAQSLKDALRYFWLATAARLARGHTDAHSTMLVHTSQFADIHQKFKGPIERFRRESLDRVKSNDSQFLSQLEKQWEEEQSRISLEEVPRDRQAFADVRPHLEEAIDRSEVVVENYLTDDEDRLAYGDQPGFYIVIGGNILSRGLTLEGLITSYFVRSASAYDTMLQMGRWFGYRSGYEDLPRVWMTDELRSYFFELAAVEEELRYDIERYDREGLTPEQFAPRVRTHPQLMITSRMKMQTAVDVYLSYSDKRPQTILFHHRNRDWLLNNLAAARDLILGSPAQSPEKTQTGRWIIRDVPVDQVVKFFEAYRFHEAAWNLRSDAIIDYIRDENQEGSLARWNVVVVGQQRNQYGQIDLGLREEVNLIKRSRINTPDLPYANLKAIASDADWTADLEPEGSTEEDIAEVRNRLAPETGLLLLYPIDRKSEPARPPQSGRRNVRTALGAVEDVIGVALAFPESKRATPGRKYKTQDLSQLVQEVPELPDEDEQQ